MPTCSLTCVSVPSAEVMSATTFCLQNQLQNYVRNMSPRRAALIADRQFDTASARQWALRRILQSHVRGYDQRLTFCCFRPMHWSQQSDVHRRSSLIPGGPSPRPSIILSINGDRIVGSGRGFTLCCRLRRRPLSPTKRRALPTRSASLPGGRDSISPYNVPPDYRQNGAGFPFQSVRCSGQYSNRPLCTWANVTGAILFNV